MSSPAILKPPPNQALARPNATAYGAPFWFAYVANTMLMVTVSLLFRYGDFVEILGGSEIDLGLIVGIGTVGSLAMRIALGTAIDHYGAHRIWMVSLLGIIAMLLAHLVIRQADSFAIYAVRIVYATSLAGAFGASITYISLRAPAYRTAEMVGMLGSSGFVGMALGAQLGDLLCGSGDVQSFHIRRLFIAATITASVSLLFVMLATRKHVQFKPKRRPPTAKLIARYHPGKLLLMGIAMGWGVTLPGTFLRPYTASIGVATIGTFFTTYAAAAFLTRMLTRRVPDRIGTRPTVILGTTLLAASMLLYLPVSTPWQLAIPAVVLGMAHGLLFPAVVAGGSVGFPRRYRGLGVTVMLAMFDLGTLVGMPVSGAIVEYADLVGLSGYPAMFVCVATTLGVLTLYYSIGRSRADRLQSRRLKQHISEAVSPQREPASTAA